MIVVIEAMSHSRPVILSNIGGLPELVDGGRVGKLVPPHDDAALAEMIASLWANEDKRRELGEAGFARVKNEYTSDLYYQRLMATYAAAMNAKAPA